MTRVLKWIVPVAAVVVAGAALVAAAGSNEKTARGAGAAAYEGSGLQATMNAQAKRTLAAQRTERQERRAAAQEPAERAAAEATERIYSLLAIDDRTEKDSTAVDTDALCALMSAKAQRQTADYAKRSSASRRVGTAPRQPRRC